MRHFIMSIFAAVTLFIGAIGLVWFLTLMLYYFAGWTYTFNPVIR